MHTVLQTIPIIVVCHCNWVPTWLSNCCMANGKGINMVNYLSYLKFNEKSNMKFIHVIYSCDRPLGEDEPELNS